MNKRAENKVGSLVAKFDVQRLMTITQQACSAMIRALSDRDALLSVNEIAQILDVPVTSYLTQLLDTLVRSGHLVRQSTASGTAYGLSRCEPGKPSEPRLPLPYHLFERYPKGDRSN